MMMPSAEENSSLRLTLLAGEPSVRVSTCGMASPILMKPGRDVWKVRAVLQAIDDLVAIVRGRRAFLKAIVTLQGGTMSMVSRKRSVLREAQALFEFGLIS